MARIVCFNSPKDSGKDEAAGRIHRGVPHSAIVPIALEMKRMTCQRYGLPPEAWTLLDLNKDTPLAELGGKTPREAYIETRKLAEAEGTYHVWADMWSARTALMLQNGSEVILMPDCRFDNEYLAAIHLVGIQNVLLVHIHRAGHSTWAGDVGHNIRVRPDGVEWVIINDGTVDFLHARAIRMWHRWVDPAFEPRKPHSLAREGRVPLAGE